MDEGAKNYSFAHILTGSNISVLVDKTKSARDGLKIAHTTSNANEESGADDISQKVKLEDLSYILKDTRSAFFTPESPTDKPIIVLDESEEEENAEKDKDTEDTSSQKEELEQEKVKAEAEVASMKAKPSHPNINQLTELLVTSLKLELSKLLASHDFASCLPAELKELPSKINGLSGEIKELKQHIKDMEIGLPGDLNKIPSKLETFTSTISSLSSQEKLKTLDSLSGLLNKVTNTLNRFATLVENASGPTTTDVPSTDKATALPAEGEKDADSNLKNELVDLLGIDIVTRYYNKKLLYEKYCEKMRKRRQSSKIINCDVLTKKGPISLKVYREDGTSEVIEKFKVSDLQLAEWREVVQACPHRKEKGWKTINDLIKTRMEYLEQTKKELHIDFNKSLQEQDPLDELNDLANKKRKRTGDSIDHSKSSKKHKSSSSI
ncbi:hypothetical protein Tco_1449641 [Tanacetum coccineum]